MRLLYTLIIAFCAAVAVSSAGTSFGWNHDDILDELRNLDKPKESKPSNTDDPIANLLAGAGVQIVANESDSNMYYSMPDESKGTLLITNRSAIIPTIDKYCHLFKSLIISLESDDGSGPQLAHSVNTYCPPNVELIFMANGKSLQEDYTYQHATEVLISSPGDSPNFQLHRMFPSVEKLTLILSSPFRLQGNLPNLTDIDITEQDAKLADLEALALRAPFIRKLKVDLWWEPEHLRQIDRLFTQLESLHISFKSETSPAAARTSSYRPIHFRNVKHFTVEFFFFGRGIILGCVNKLAGIQFNQLESMKYISMNGEFPREQVQLITQNKDLTSVLFGAITLPKYHLEALINGLPKLQHLTLFSSANIDSILLAMNTTSLEAVTAVGDNEMRNALLKQTQLLGNWTLETDGLFTMPNLNGEAPSLTFRRRA